MYTFLLKKAIRLVFKFPKKNIVLFVISGIVAASEGLSMSLMVPLAESVQGGINVASQIPLDIWKKLFLGITPIERIQIVAFLLIAITIFKGGCLFCFQYIKTLLQIEVVKYYRMKCMDHMLKVNIGFLNRQKTSDIFQMTADYTKWTGTLVSQVGSLMPNIFSCFILVVYLFMLSWQLTIAALVLVGLASISLHFLVKIAARTGKESNIELLKLSHVLLSALSGMKEVRVYNKENFIKEEFGHFVGTQAKESFKNALANASVGPSFEIITISCFSAILFFSTIFLSGEDSVWLTKLLVFMMILLKIIIPIAQINKARIQTAGIIPPVIQLDSLLKVDESSYIQSGNIQCPKISKGIEFKNVSFRYNAENEYVLNGISLKIDKGSKIGIVGHSGSGKTTLMDLLLRFYDPIEGKIEIDGNDLKDFDISSWRDRIGVVLQDSFLFNASVRDNIAFANKDVDFDLVKNAAKLAQAHEFISAMPDGYDTILGDRGVRLSGGQKQRIAIARAILKDPEILLFDEATSSLDTESEQKIQKAMHEVRKGRTLIVIAHRLATIADADNIVVFNDGRIIESGTHDMLIAKNGLYHKLSRLQSISNGS